MQISPSFLGWTYKLAQNSQRVSLMLKSYSVKKNIVAASTQLQIRPSRIYRRCSDVNAILSFLGWTHQGLRNAICGSGLKLILTSTSYSALKESRSSDDVHLIIIEVLRSRQSGGFWGCVPVPHRAFTGPFGGATRVTDGPTWKSLTSMLAMDDNFLFEQRSKLPSSF